MIITITMIIKKNEVLVRPLGYDITAKYSSSPTSIKAEYIRLLCPNILSSQVTLSNGPEYKLLPGKTSCFRPSSTRPKTFILGKRQ